MTTKDGQFIWIDGKFEPWESAHIHVMSNTVQYGMGVFEGLRAYENSQGSAIFRLHDHTDRLFASAHIFNIKIPYSKEQLIEAQIEAVRKNMLRAAYIRPMVFLGHETLGLHAKNLSTHVMVAAWNMGVYLSTHDTKKGLRLHTSSIQRLHPASHMSKAKANGHYINSIIAYQQAQLAGYDDAVLLDNQGCIAEATSSNVFIVKNNRIFTPNDAGILQGITRDTIMEICKTRGIDLVTKDITRDEAYTADEMFVSGTAAEIKSVTEFDGRSIGTGFSGPMTAKIQEFFSQITSGKDDNFSSWLTQI